MAKRLDFATLFAVLLIVGIPASVAYSVYEFATGASRLRPICAKFVDGLPLADARRLAAAEGLAPTAFYEGTTYLGEKRMFGRFGCRVTIAAGVVKASIYDYYN